MAGPEPNSQAASRSKRGQGCLILLAVIPLGLILAVTQRTSGPSRAELADALSHADGGEVARDDLRSVRCDRTSSVQGIACRWQRRKGGEWVAQAGRFRADGSGWHLVSETGSEQF